MSPEAQARAKAKAQQMIAEMALDELREARALTQTELADILKINQAAVSKIERRADMYVSTLRNFIRALGGDLEIRARFPEGEVKIKQFSELAEASAKEGPTKET